MKSANQQSSALHGNKDKVLTLAFPSLYSSLISIEYNKHTHKQKFEYASARVPKNRISKVIIFLPPTFISVLSASFFQSNACSGISLYSFKQILWLCWVFSGMCFHLHAIFCVLLLQSSNHQSISTNEYISLNLHIMIRKMEC